MSNYVWGSHLSYQDYTQAKKFVGDITGASRETGRRVSMEVSRQTREIIASQEALAREQITVAEQSTRAMQEGFQTLSYGLSEISSGLSDVSSGISELNATFHWGFSEMLAGPCRGIFPGIQSTHGPGKRSKGPIASWQSHRIRQVLRP